MKRRFFDLNKPAAQGYEKKQKMTIQLDDVINQLIGTQAIIDANEMHKDSDGKKVHTVILNVNANHLTTIDRLVLIDLLRSSPGHPVVTLNNFVNQFAKSTQMHMQPTIEFSLSENEYFDFIKFIEKGDFEIAFRNLKMKYTEAIERESAQNEPRSGSKESEFSKDPEDYIDSGPAKGYEDEDDKMDIEEERGPKI